MNKTKLFITTIIAVIIFFSGYFVGKSKSIVKEVIRYEERGNISGGVPSNLLKPTTVFKANISDLPDYYLIRDTLHQSDTVMVLDTVRLINEHLVLREYNNTLFDNKELGRLDVKSKVQFNQLIGLDYDFKPRQKVVTRTIERTFQPFVSLNYHTIDVVGVGAGAFIGNLGVEFLYNRSLDRAIHNHSFFTIGAKYKF